MRAQPSLPTHVCEKAWDQEDKSIISFPWERMMRLRGANARRAKVYLATRDGRRCTLCGGLVKNVLRELEFDHINSNRTNNQRWNLRLTHHACNASEYWRGRLASPVQPPVCECENEGGQVGVFPVSGTPWSGREGEKHDVMRARWNAWVTDFERGPFRGPEGRMRVRDLAEMAPRALGLGSSATYRRYINEDRFGPLEIVREDGVLFVRMRASEETGGKRKELPPLPPKGEQNEDPRRYS